MILAVFDQQSNRFVAEVNLSDRIFRFRFCHDQLALAARHRFGHGQRFRLQIEVAPQQCHQLPAPQAGTQFQIEHRQDAPFLRRFQVIPNLLRRDNLHFLLFFFR